MITTTTLAAAYDRNVNIVKQQAEGLSHADSLIQLPFRANCLNWVVGHLVTNRITVLKLLEVQEFPFDEGSLTHYQYDSQPITADGEGVLSLDQLLTMLEQAQGIINTKMSALTDEVLSRPLTVFGDHAQPLADWLFFFFFHDCYHTGQTEILRQAAGKDDKII
jgi:hypothetical protein